MRRGTIWNFIAAIAAVVSWFLFFRATFVAELFWVPFALPAFCACASAVIGSLFRVRPFMRAGLAAASAAPFLITRLLDGTSESPLGGAFLLMVAIGAAFGSSLYIVWGVMKKMKPNQPLHPTPEGRG